VEQGLVVSVLNLLRDGARAKNAFEHRANVDCLRRHFPNVKGNFYDLGGSHDVDKPMEAQFGENRSRKVPNLLRSYVWKYIGQTVQAILPHIQHISFERYC
jgi:hypothetical protein